MKRQVIGPVMLLVILDATHLARADEAPSTDALAPAGPVQAQDVIDAVDAAAAQWARSCKKPDAEGLCITRAAPKASAERCAAPLLGRVTVQPRNAVLARRAQAGFDEALRRAERVTEPTEEAVRIAYREAIVRAKLAKADLELERYLTITMPTKLDFFVEEWKQGSGVAKWEEQYEQQVARKNASTKSFKEFYERKTELGGRLIDGYSDVEPAKSADGTTKAALRTAWVAQDMADQLRTAPVPKRLAAPEIRAAYCEALERQSVALLEQARDAVQSCVDHAAEAALTGPTVDACRDLLSKLPAAATK